MDKRTRTNLLFYIKRTKLKKNGQAPVYLKLTVNGESCEISIGCSVIPEIWSPDKGGAIGTTKEARIVNDYISQTSFQIHQHIRNLREDEKEITITAWYTPEIPVSQGPEGYWGLPGLILEVNDGKTTILCSKVVLNPKEKADIKAPATGKEVSQKEYDEIVIKKMEEMSEMGGRGGFQMRMNR